MSIIYLPVLVTMTYHGNRSHIHGMNVTDVARMTMDVSRTILEDLLRYIYRPILSLMIELTINIRKPINRPSQTGD